MAATPEGYMPGFGNDFETEALAGALPVGQNSPQRCPYGLYAEQLSGSPFTAPRGSNERSWLYRIRPSVRHTGRFEKAEYPYWKTAPVPREHDRPIGPLRWSPVPIPEAKLNFVAGVRTMTTAGDVNTQTGLSVGLYFVTQSMIDDYFYNADGEFLIVPQQGSLTFLPNSVAFRSFRAKSASFRAASNSRSNSSTVPRADIFARITARNSPFPTVVRSAPIVWPTRATSRRPSRLSRIVRRLAG